METTNLTKNETGPDINDEASLVEAARLEPEAFAALYHCYLTPVYRYLLRRLSSVQDAEDLTALVFTDALEGLVAYHYKKGSSFAAWLFTIARRRLVDFYRQHTSAPLNDPPSSEPSLLATIEKGEDLQRLTHLLILLDEERQELLRLRFSAGLSFAQIGLLEGRNEAAVKMAIYRSIEFLHQHWEKENG